MEKETLIKLEQISIELTVLSDTFRALEIALSEGASEVPSQALSLPVNCLCSLSKNLEETVKSMQKERRNVQCQ